MINRTIFPEHGTFLSVSQHCFMCRYEMKDALQQTSALKHHTHSHSALSVMLINNPQRIESYLQHSPAGIALSGSLLIPDRLLQSSGTDESSDRKSLSFFNRILNTSASHSYKLQYSFRRPRLYQLFLGSQSYKIIVDNIGI